MGCVIHRKYSSPFNYAQGLERVLNIQDTLSYLSSICNFLLNRAMLNVVNGESLSPDCFAIPFFNRLLRLRDFVPKSLTLQLKKEPIASQSPFLIVLFFQEGFVFGLGHEVIKTSVIGFDFTDPSAAQGRRIYQFGLIFQGFVNFSHFPVQG